MSLVLALLLLGIALLLWVRLFIDIRLTVQPARHLLAGRYAEARAAAERLDRSWMRLLPSTRQAAGYTIACARHLEGDLDAAIELARALDTPNLTTNLRYAVCSLEAASLVLAGREPARALELLERAGKVQTRPEDLLLAAHAKHDLGDTAEAAALFDKAGAERPERGARIGIVVLVEAHAQQEAIFHYLRGWYLLKTRRASEAHVDLARAANSPIHTVYVKRARLALAESDPRPVDDDAEDPRSSLAPQVVARPASRPDR